jgi:hypothetical protein
MAWIFDRYTYNKRLQLAHEEYVRPLSIGTNWQSIRIGIRYCINDSARATISASYSGGFGLYVGVKQGGGPSIFSDSLVDWIGGGYIGQTFPVFGLDAAFNAGTPNYFSNLNRLNAMSKIGATTVFTAESIAAFFGVGSGAAGNYGAQFMNHFYVEITKGTPNYTVVIYFPNSAANAQINTTDANFLSFLETTAAPTGTGTATKNLPYSGAGLFDTLSIASYKSWPHIEIDMIGVSRKT